MRLPIQSCIWCPLLGIFYRGISAKEVYLGLLVLTCRGGVVGFKGVARRTIGLKKKKKTPLKENERLEPSVARKKEKYQAVYRFNDAGMSEQLGMLSQGNVCIRFTCFLGPFRRRRDEKAERTWSMTVLKILTSLALT